jgi:hypothetical protein
MNDLAQFTHDNIKEINAKISSFTFKNLKSCMPENSIPHITATDIVPYLSNKFTHYLQVNPITLINELNNITSLSIPKIKEEILSISNSYVFLYNDVLAYFENSILENIRDTYFTKDSLRKDMLTRLLTYNQYSASPNTESQIYYIKNTLKKLLDQSLYIGLSNGFTRNLTNINTGTKTANEGDSAQFLFLARAILAGFNCSNVDVRSSRYDAIVDYNNHLLRVQIKGISDNSISLKDRDRAGEGIDPNSPRNQGKYISSIDSDIYVAVDKSFGICYIIPTSKIDEFVGARKSSVSLAALTEYKENWNIIAAVEASLYS